MATLTVQSLTAPVLLDGTKIHLQFTGDATVGAIFTQLRHKEGGNFDHVTFLNDAGFGAEYNGRMWELEGTLLGGATFTAHPGLASSFIAYDATAAYGGFKSYLFEWRGVVITGAVEGDRLWVRVLATLAAEGDQTAKFYGWFGRERGESFAVEYFRCPILMHKAPSELRGAETHLVGSKRARVLIPQNSFSGTPTYSSNSATFAWMGLDRYVSHPSTMMMQFFAHCSCNDLGASYLRMLYAQTEDVLAHFNRLYIRGVNYTGGNAFLRFAPAYVPSFAKAHGRSNAEFSLLAESEFGNTYYPGYAVAVGALTAASQDWWYDACVQYRTWAESVGYAGVKIATDTLRSISFTRSPSLFMGFINIVAADATLYPTFLERARALAIAMNGPYVSANNAALHLQTFRRDGVALGSPPEPIETAVDPAAVSMVTEANALGWKTSFFWAMRQCFPAQDYRTLPAESVRTRRDGLPTGINGPTQLVDFAAGPTLSWFAGLHREMFDYYPFAGIYLDEMAGEVDVLSYTTGGTGNGQRRWHLTHGGNYFSVGKYAVVQQVRSILRARGDLNAFILSEANQEILAQLIDFYQDGYNWIPNHLLFAEPTVYSGVGLIPDLTLTDYPIACRTMSPPLWAAVYHEYTVAIRFTSQPSSTALASNILFHGGGFAGLSDQQYIDAHSAQHAMLFAAGMSPAAFDYNSQYDYPIIIRTADGTSYRTDPAFASAGVGTTTFGYLNTLYQALQYSHAGQFLLYGKMLRPLIVDYAAAGITKGTNPIAPMRNTNPQVFLQVWPFGYYDSADPTFLNPLAWGSASWSLVAAQHSVWQSFEGVKGLVITNWSNAAAAFIGTFTPGLYGFGGSVTFTRLVQGGAPIALGASAATVTIGTTGSGATIDIGLLPARSVAVITFT